MTRALPGLAAALLLLTGLCAWGQEEPRRPAASQPATRPARSAAVGVPQNLEGAMRDMGRLYRSLTAEAGDFARREQTLRDIGLMERDVAIAKNSLPPLVNRQSGDEQARQIASYRSMMISMLRTLLDLEEAVADQKADEVKKILAQLEEIQQEGHKEFAPREEHD